MVFSRASFLTFVSLLTTGDVFSLRAGTELAVVLNSESAIRSAFARPELCARPDTFMFRFFSMGERGVASASGERWEAQRRFMHSALGRMGFGRPRMEELMQEEVGELCQLFSEKSKESETVEIGRDINVSVVNCTWGLVAGERRSHSDEKMKDFLYCVQRGIELASTSAVLLFAPWLLRFLPERLLGIPEMREMRDRTHDFLQEVIDEHKESRQEGEPARDFIDAFLDEKEKPGHHESFDDELQLKMVCAELFAAGAEPTSATIRWAIRFLTENPEVQEKARDEIESVVGSHRRVELSDKPDLPYLRAAIQDAVRLSDIHPVGILHAPSEDTDIDGLRIPKNSFVFPNFHRVHRDPSLWECPEELRPEHWLDSATGAFVPQRPGFVAYSSGRRRCPGQEVGQALLFCFLANLVQRFEFSLAEGDSAGKVETSMGVVVGPRPYRLVVKERS